MNQQLTTNSTAMTVVSKTTRVEGSSMSTRYTRKRKSTLATVAASAAAVAAAAVCLISVGTTSVIPPLMMVSSFSTTSITATQQVSSIVGQKISAVTKATGTGTTTCLEATTTRPKDRSRGSSSSGGGSTGSTNLMSGREGGCGGGNSNSYGDVTPPSDFELSVGKALDTLREDYPYLLTSPPSYELYARDIEFIDPSGVHLHGLSAYKNSWRVLHAIVKLIYCPERSEMTFKMCFDKARQNIRCSWNARVVPREIFGGVRRPLHVDGISVYEFDRNTGNITQHRIERLLVNNIPVQPEQGVIAALHEQQSSGVSVPSFIQQEHHHNHHHSNHVFEFQLLPAGSGLGGGGPSSLFAMEANGQASSAMSGNPAESSSSSDGFDWDALDKKNKSRKKFGLKPLSREEFLKIEAEVQQLSKEQQQRAAAMTASAAEMEERRAESKKPGFLEKLFGNVMKDTCESNFDCERPEICCDFGFKKMCCASGSPVGAQLQYAYVPVPVNIEDPTKF